MDLIITWWALLWIAGVVYAVALVNTKRLNGIHILAAVFFGPVVTIFMLGFDAQTDKIDEHRVLTKQAKKCPECAEVVRLEARKCRYCHSTLTTLGAATSAE